MMNDISYQIEIINVINSCGIQQSDYKEELIDHYLTMYESNFNGTNRDLLLQKILNNINNEHKKTKKSIIMGNTIFISIASFLLFLIIGSYGLFTISTPDEHTNESIALSVNDHNYDPPFGYPIDSDKISAKFGKMKHPITKDMRFHKGIDFPAKLGTEIKSVESGIVVDEGYNDKLGNYIEIKHDDIYITRYYHMAKIHVVKGEKITKNQIIGLVGSTGLSTAPHLHYEILKNGEHVDPSDYLRA